MKKYLMFSFVCTLSIMKAYSTEYENLVGAFDNKNTISSCLYNNLSTQVLDNFKQNKSVIENHLSSVEEAQLHFFWTRGYTFNDNSEYNPNKTVNIGGSDYKDKFFPYANQLLEHSPDKLIVKFTLDKLTWNSNKKSIEHLQNLYQSRFQVAFIEDVQEKILNHFTDPQQQAKIKAIFNNATAGSPVLASDIYRAVGMVYGHNQSFDPTKVLYTYSDVDAFCYGMEVDANWNKKLIQSLFASDVDTQSAFYLGRSYTNNDVIKLRIENIDAYKKFCGRIISNVDTQNSVIDHFTKLHEKIRSCDNKNPAHIDIENLVPQRIDDLIDVVTLATGPKFLSDKYVMMDLKYPSKTAGAWYAPEDILNYITQRYTIANPANVFVWNFDETTTEERDAVDAFTNQCNDYLRFISAAFYAKPFGVDHPFNIALRKYLKDNFPYHSETFINTLRMSFKIMNQKVDIDYELILLKEHLKTQQSNIRIYLKDSGKVGYCYMNESQNFISGEINIIFPDDGKTHDIEYMTDHYMPKFKNKIYQKIVDQHNDLDSDLNLIYGLPKQINIEKESKIVYLKKLNDEELSFNLLSSDEQKVQGIIKIHNEGELNSRNLRKHSFEILQQLKNQGYSLQSKPGLSYDEWKKQIIHKLFESGNKNIESTLHYQRLNYVLKQLDIEFPPIEIPDEATLLN